ncbi:MAG: nitrogen fixation protein NifU [Clostridiales bacterium]|nr:nitrogen fixation protein NifU [Clostridiales bacterium]MDN5298101.1 nitrogen fixation protein NifU [Clostridiales bacterium]
MTDHNMYSEIILMHNRSGHNRHALSGETHAERGHNPSCGDDLTLHLRVVDGIIESASYTGSGCALSQASISIMIDLITGMDVDSAKNLANDFFNMARGETISPEAEEALQDAMAFQNIAKMPARTKCGTLGWHCLTASIEADGEQQ